MDLDIKPGKYVVAVSGGVDSMVLLDLLVKQAQSSKLKAQSSNGEKVSAKSFQPSAFRLQLIVAHYDHGIRPDSLEDLRLVKETARRYGLPFVTAHGNLGPGASEATSRRARYDFLYHVMAEEQTDGIITAHHQDDMLETAVINMLRGTGRLGLSSLRSKDTLIRPFLDYTKAEIRDYATTHNVQWREDSTNADEKYLRNYVRQNIMTRLGDKGREMLLDRLRHAQTINDQIDAILSKDLDLQPALDQLKRSWFVKLPYAVAREVMATWLRRNGILGYNRQLIGRLVEFAMTKVPGKLADVDATHMLASERDGVKLINRSSKHRPRSLK